MLSLALVGLFLASVTSDDAPVTKECCFPETFTASIAGHSGFPFDSINGVNRAENTLQFDFAKKRWAYRSRIIYVSGDKRDVVWIEDYNTRELTAIVEECIISELKWQGEMRLPCVPKTAEFTGKHTMGSMNYESWLWERTVDTQNNQNLPTTFALNMFEDCTPMTTISMATLPKQNFFLAAYVEYNNIDLGIDDNDNIFTAVEKYIAEKGCTTRDTLKSSHVSIGESVEAFDTLFQGRAFDPEG